MKLKHMMCEVMSVCVSSCLSRGTCPTCGKDLSMSL